MLWDTLKLQGNPTFWSSPRELDRPLACISTELVRQVRPLTLGEALGSSPISRTTWTKEGRLDQVVELLPTGSLKPVLR